MLMLIYMKKKKLWMFKFIVKHSASLHVDFGYSQRDGLTHTSTHTSKKWAHTSGAVIASPISPTLRLQLPQRPEADWGHPDESALYCRFSSLELVHVFLPSKFYFPFKQSCCAGLVYIPRLQKYSISLVRVRSSQQGYTGATQIQDLICGKTSKNCCSPAVIIPSERTWATGPRKVGKNIAFQMCNAERRIPEDLQL